MARLGLGGFPGFVRESDGRFDVLPHTQLYGQPASSRTCSRPHDRAKEKGAGEPAPSYAY